LNRGTLNSGKTGIAGTPSWTEDFTYDPIGNWDAYLTKVSGVTDLDQTRTHNTANETTEIDGSSTTVANDLAGNMVKVPQVSDWESTFDLKWDAWNRLVEVADGETTVAQYRYDGITRRITKETDATRHYFYSDRWQILEERVEDETAAERQFIWGQRYLDDLVLRDRDTDHDGSLDERLYVLSDYFNPTAIADEDGVVLERYGYNAFGLSRVMNADFEPRSTSDFDWETRYGAYRYDAETGFYQVRFRYLLPTLGRWLSRDPVKENGGKNVFCYIYNSPTNSVDYLGLAPAPIVPPTGSCSVKDCKAAENELQKKGTYGNDSTLSALAGYLKAKKCKFEINCLEANKCKSGETKLDTEGPAVSYIGGREIPGIIKISTLYVIDICPSALSTTFSLVRTLRHEMAHLVKYCAGDKSDNCESALAHELFAYSKDGGCDPKKFDKVAYYYCLKEAARGSVKKSMACAGKTEQELDLIMIDAFVESSLKGPI
jgi:RHS repeat-associated protein